MRDVFTLSLGNLAVNASASVRLEYVTQVGSSAWICVDRSPVELEHL